MNDDFPVTYESLKKFFFVVLDAQVDVSGLPPDKRPATVLENYEAKGLRAAMKVLRADVSILVVPLARMAKDQVEQISAQLSEVGAPSISMVKAWLKRENVAVFERGKISSDDESQRLGSLLDAGDLTEREVALVQSLLDSYEFGKSQD